MNIRDTSSVGPATFDYLTKESFIQLTTFRKSGQAVPTPVWFALEQGRLYVTTVKGAAKVKRIRNNGQVRLAPCNRRGVVQGPEISGQARELPVEEQHIGKEALARKYGLMYRIFMGVGKLRKTQQTIIEIQPS
ncbi:PPOX class F420-dependent oxidoreductase [Dictyobacter aurantiacus]|uniref:PPOX class F420-dependent oxidoreductase n=1 Tax=Dictyobacter aurantiacus TaxID=1936993 RepID=A0A401ZCW3_9CHLR|nr:PPOX class F420-dependent oxidoreductase [Dictyobacter aurantiacus]GCE04689.1 PPOX class F420-dependent oxidoreductase [Dictyobacter aurantiacus]